MKTTQNTPYSYNSRRFLIALLIWLLLLAGLIAAFIYVWRHPLEETGLFQTNAVKVLYLFPLGFCILLLACWPFSAIAGVLRARRQIVAEEKTISTIDPHQFYKHLPNDYGIGVTSLLCDSQLENEKDIIAALLDLCAQKYLHLSKHSDHYVIRIEPNPSHTPLANEAYLLNLIQSGQLAQVDYRKWYDLCADDGINLGLFNRRTADPQTRAQKAKNHLPILLTIAGVAFLIAMAARIFLPDAEALTGVLSFVVTIAALAAVCDYLYILFNSLGRISRDSAHLNYKIALENQLRRTQKGTEELQELHAFKNFLAQFNTFVDKDPEAVILWDRYLSYAQVFGLADELMHSGYHQLVDNATFQIDNINDISLSNLRSSTN